MISIIPYRSNFTAESYRFGGKSIEEMKAKQLFKGLNTHCSVPYLPCDIQYFSLCLHIFKQFPAAAVVVI